MSNALNSMLWSSELRLWNSKLRALELLCELLSLSALTSSELVKCRNCVLWQALSLSNALSSMLWSFNFQNCAIWQAWACQKCRSWNELEPSRSRGGAESEPRRSWLWQALGLSNGTILEKLLACQMDRDIDFVPFDKLKACQMLWIQCSGDLNSEAWALNSELWNDGANLIGNIHISATAAAADPLKRTKKSFWHFWYFSDFLENSLKIDFWGLQGSLEVPGAPGALGEARGSI